MTREVRRLQRKALDSLLLAVEHFTRPPDAGRADAVLILLDHSFEMLLKSAIVHRGGRIREPGEALTIGVPECIRWAVSHEPASFLSHEEALTLQGINGLRNEAQHYFVDVSEPHLALYAQAGFTLFGDVLQRVFGTSLSDFLPRRVLPVATERPHDLDRFVETEVEVITQMAQPGKRRRAEAGGRLRALLVMERMITGGLRPSEGEVDVALDALLERVGWRTVFSGIASLRMSAEGEGTPLGLRIVLKDGVGVHLVPAGAPGGNVVAVTSTVAPPTSR